MAACSSYGCKKKAVFKTFVEGKPFAKEWCEQHFKEKVARYELTVKRLYLLRLD